MRWKFLSDDSENSNSESLWNQWGEKQILILFSVFLICISYKVVWIPSQGGLRRWLTHKLGKFKLSITQFFAPFLYCFLSSIKFFVSSPMATNRSTSPPNTRIWNFNFQLSKSSNYFFFLLLCTTDKMYPFQSHFRKWLITKLKKFKLLPIQLLVLLLYYFTPLIKGQSPL